MVGTVNGMRRLCFVSVSLVAVVDARGLWQREARRRSSSTDTQTAQPASVTYEAAGANPSISAKMICQAEAIERDRRRRSRSRPLRVTKPTWVDHVYSCTYVYPHGKIVLSVKELRQRGRHHRVLQQPRGEVRQEAEHQRSRAGRVPRPQRRRRRAQGLQGAPRRREGHRGELRARHAACRGRREHRGHDHELLDRRLEGRRS